MSVSPKYCLRSEWPTITYSVPISHSMAAEISPVYAPDAAKWTFSAPTFIGLPFAASITGTRSTYGTQATISQPSVFLPASSAFMAFISSTASEGVLFIFQFPAITVFLNARFILGRSLFVVKAGDARKLEALEELKRRSAAG